MKPAVARPPVISLVNSEIRLSRDLGSTVWDWADHNRERSAASYRLVSRRTTRWLVVFRITAAVDGVI